MKKAKNRNFLRGALTFATAGLIAGCGGPPDGFTEEEWTVVQELTPLPPVPADPTNKYADDPQAAILGQKLFFETRYSGPIKVAATPEEGALGDVGATGKVSCASCHLPGSNYSDTRSVPNNVSLAVGRPGRNSPPMVNVAYYDWFTWGGKRDSLWAQGALAFEAPTDTNGNRCNYTHMIFDHYRAEYEAIFGHVLPEALAEGHAEAARFPAYCKPKAAGAEDGEWEKMAPEDRETILQLMANIGKAIAAYERKLISGDAPFDRYVAGEKDAISDSAKRGLKLFVGKAFCVQCHGDGDFQDGEFHNLGVPQEGPNVPAEDKGRFSDIPIALNNPFISSGKYSDDPAYGAKKLEGVVATDAQLGQFRTKGLRNVALSGPYMHNGVFSTLREVVDFYAAGGGSEKFVGTKDAKLKPIDLSESEREDLVAFLESLTGTPPPAELGKMLP